MTLFLDTPRANGGLNHRFFVTSPNDCNEATIREYAQRARENVIGTDYLAASRTVHQVTRGQVRDGSELIVLYGISTNDPDINNILLKRLKEMLHLVSNEPIPVCTPSFGMLVENQQIEKFERELNNEYSMVESPYSPSIQRPTHSGRKLFGPRRILALMSVVAIAVSFPQLMTSLGGKGNGGSDKGTASQTQRSDEQGTEKAPKEFEDWSFLRGEEWKRLGGLTGLKEEWTTKEAEDWATNLLREADPSQDTKQVLSDGLKPNDFKQNREVSKLAELCKENNDADRISEDWLNQIGNDSARILDFWKELKELAKDNKVESLALKNLLRAWIQEVRTAEESEESSKVLIAPSPKEANPNRITILVKNDLKLFDEVEQYLTSDKFFKFVGVQEPKEWKKAEWSSRLQLIRGMVVPEQDDKCKQHHKGIVDPLNSCIGKH